MMNATAVGAGIAGAAIGIGATVAGVQIAPKVIEPSDSGSLSIDAFKDMMTPGIGGVIGGGAAAGAGMLILSNTDNVAGKAFGKAAAIGGGVTGVAAITGGMLLGGAAAFLFSL